MAPDAQLKLARQISSRTLADVKPARYLPGAKYVALFPDSLDRLVLHAGLTERLASVFAGYPINVPPLKDRKQAVLRWAHKILSQESAARDRPIKGFTPDAEQAMLSHEWPGVWMICQSANPGKVPPSLRRKGFCGAAFGVSSMGSPS